jgi:hypothetical protein
MLLKSSRNLNRRRGSLDLQIPHRRSREKAAPTQKIKVDKEMINPISKNGLSHKQIKAMRR